MPFKTERNLRLAFAGPHAGVNLAQAGVLLTAFALLVALASWPELGAGGIFVAVLAVAAIVALALYLPPRTLMRLYGARAHAPASLKQVDTLLAEIARRAALSRSPALCVITSTMPTAFAVGTPDRSAITVTEGLLRQLSMREIAAVLAQQVSHVCLGDLLVLSIADFVTRFAQVLYYLGLTFGVLNLWRLITRDELVSWWTVALLVLAPFLLNLLQLSLSRARAFAADRAAALVTGDPLGLASAIARLDTSSGSMWDDLLPPVPARKVPRPSLLRCPPGDEARIARLRALDVPQMPPLDVEEVPRISLVGVGPIAMRPRYRWPGVWF